MKIRKLTAALLALAMLCPLTAALPASAAEDWKAAYQQLLKSNATSATDDLMAVKYSLGDIVGDGIPELMISNGEYHMATVKVYTWYQGKAVLLEELPEYGYLQFDLTTGELVGSKRGQGYFWEQRFAYYCGALVPTIDFSDNDGTDEPHYYKINGESVSESTYNDYRNTLIVHQYMQFGRDYLATDFSALNSYTVTNPVAVLGNVNQDMAINASDAAQILIAAATYGASSRTGLSQAQETAADVNGDHAITASDAAIVLIYSAAVGAGKNVKLTDFIR